jgi:excinuclease ABC subunit B
MKRAIDETETAPPLAGAFNKKHSITPQTIVKALGSPLIKIYDADYVDIPLAAEDAAKYGTRNASADSQTTKRNETSSERLEFEKAAELRDRIRELQTQELALRESSVGSEEA